MTANWPAAGAPGTLGSSDIGAPPGLVSLASTGTVTVSPARTVATSSLGAGRMSGGSASRVTVTSPVTGAVRPSVTVYRTICGPGVSAASNAVSRSQCPSTTAAVSWTPGAGSADCTTSTAPAGAKSLASTSTTAGIWPRSTTESGIATGGA